MMPQRGGKRPRGDRGDDEDEEQVGIAMGLVFLSSGDDEDEEANRDLSLEIVEKARERLVGEKGSNNLEGGAPLERRIEQGHPVIDLSSSSDEAVGVSSGRNNQGEAGDAQPASAAVVELSKKKKKKRKKSKKQTAEGVDDGASLDRPIVDVAVDKSEEELIESGCSGMTEANGDTFNNIVYRKLLRGPRYFDPECSRRESCYNCGEEGHVAADCTAEKRKRPCFVCGFFGHNANKCSQGQYCFICKRRGHLARECPDKRRRAHQDDTVCLRCGDVGHDMSVCTNEYPPDDLKNVQCYVCKDFGHFCCVDFIDTAPSEVCCYNCGDLGHSGVGCARPRGESSSVALPTLCYVCGEEGHFARGCSKKSKFGRQHREPSSSSTPKSYRTNKTNPRYPMSRRDSFGSKTPQADFTRGSKSVPDSNLYRKNRKHLEGKRDHGAGRSRVKIGWMVDDPGEFPVRGRGFKPFMSPQNKPARKVFGHYASTGSSYHLY